MIIIGVIGLLFLGLGLYMRFGGAKVMYMTPGIPVLMPQAVQNMFIPLGITFIMWSVSWSIPDVKLGNTLDNFLVMPMLVITIILGIWNPRWLRPRWLVYLHDTYGPSLTQKMFKVALENAREWSHKVRTQQGLEEWAEETCLALGYDIPMSEQEMQEMQENTIRQLLEESKKKAQSTDKNAD